MPVVDKKNDLTIAKNNLKKSVKQAVSRQTLSNQGKNASKLTKAAEINLPNLIKSSLSEVNEAISDGKFYVSIKVHKKLLNKLFDYYKNRDYIVIKKLNDTSGDNLIICWIGGKNWIKSQLLENATNDEVNEAVYERLKEIIKDAWWVSPKLKYEFNESSMNETKFKNKNEALKFISKIIRKL